MSRIDDSDLTAIYYTANKVPQTFQMKMIQNLIDVAMRMPIVSVSVKPMMLGDNIIYSPNNGNFSELVPNHFAIYEQALIGAQAATTKYIALCEDDVLYSKEHFKFRPSPGKFGYNMNAWMVYTWVRPALFSQKPGGRKNLNGLICERELFIEAMQERFNKFAVRDLITDSEGKIKQIWAEPGKYERQLGVTIREIEHFHVNPPNVIFTHRNELSYLGLGERKRLGEIRATEIPHWGNAKDIRELYV